MTTNSTAKKLGIKAGMRALIVGAPPGYLKLLTPLPEGVVVSEVADGEFPFVQFFATRRSEIDNSISKVLRHAAPGAVVWITYPKKTSGMESDLSREVLWDAMSAPGWRAVAAVAVGKVWSGLRFRPAEEVKSQAPSKPWHPSGKPARTEKG